MQWKTKNQERKKRKRRGLARTLGAVTAVGSSLGLGSLINTDTSDISQLTNQIADLNQKIENEKKETDKAKKEAEQQKNVNVAEFTDKCKDVVSSGT